MEQISEILKQIRIKSKKNQADFAKEIGVAQTTWSAYEAGKTRPKMVTLLALERMGYVIPGLTTGVVSDMKEQGLITEDNIQDRKELIKQYPPDTSINTLPSSEEHLFRFKNGHTVPVPALKTDTDALILLPVYGQRASAGPGQPPANLPDIESYIPILYEMLGGANPKNCGCVRVVGDSMVDMSLFNGDIVIFDRTQLEGDGVYVISIGADVRVKHLEYRAFEKKIIISSENARRYPNPEAISYEQAANMLLIHGKVICWMHKHPY